MVAHISSIAELVHIVRSLFISRMCSAVAITLVMYDWILVFRHEFETIYQSRWSLPKALLLYIRVFTPPCLMITAFTLSDLRPALNPQVSEAWVYIQSFGMLTCLFAANGLLALRLIALYRRKKWLVWFIAAFYLSSYIATFGLVVNSMITYHSSIYYAAPLHSRHLSFS
ncbi:hypothetical protein FRC16_009994 [Serendipita sp. 398]|nr:hypothetical protein FRC16_009994 [Serendipita sp. 398]